MSKKALKSFRLRHWQTKKKEVACTKSCQQHQHDAQALVLCVGRRDSMLCVAFFATAALILSDGMPLLLKSLAYAGRRLMCHQGDAGDGRDSHLSEYAATPVRIMHQVRDEHVRKHVHSMDEREVCTCRPTTSRSSCMVHSLAFSCKDFRDVDAGAQHAQAARRRRAL